MIEIRNSGAQILSTNYWQTPHAAQGLAFLSINAGAVRLLLPNELAVDMGGALAGVRQIVITYGRWSDRGMDGFEILLDDGSATPWALYIDARQADRTWPPSEDGHSVELILYCRRRTNGVTMMAHRPARLRHADIPCLEPWQEP